MTTLPCAISASDASSPDAASDAASPVGTVTKREEKNMSSERIEQAYAFAKQQYADIGVDVERSLELLSQIPISLHCWQGDDVGGFVPGDPLVLALAPVLGVALSVRVPVHPLLGSIESPAMGTCDHVFFS